MKTRLAIGAGLALLLCATGADAQKSKMGTGRPDWDKMGSPSSSRPQVLTKKDMEEMNTVKRLLDKKKDLKLTDEQVAKLKEMEAAGNSRDASLYEAMDSLGKEMRSSGGPGGPGGPGDEQRAKAFATRDAFMKSVSQLRTNYATDGKSAVEMLDAAQRPAAQSLLEKQAKDADDKVNEKMHAGRPGGRAPGGRGGPPGGRGGPPATG